MNKTANEIESQPACWRRAAELVPALGVSASITQPGRAVVETAHRGLYPDRPRDLPRSVILPDGG
jgi:hypothetical protein